MRKRAKIFVAGVSQRTTNASGVGVLMILNGRVFEISRPIGYAIKDEVVGAAIEVGLVEAQNHDVEFVDVYVPSRKIVNMLCKGKVENRSGVWKNVIELLGQFDHYTINFIQKKDNKIANELAHHASDISLAWMMSP